MNSVIAEEQTPYGFGSGAIRMRFPVDLTDDQFLRFCAMNSDLRIERTAEGEIIIMPPVGWGTSARNLDLVTQLSVWAKRDGTGVACDVDGGFRLPNGAIRGPDGAWVLKSRLAGIPAEVREKFLPLCPDFVIELVSPTDVLELVRAKMQEYVDNGLRLGWLIDPVRRRADVYRPGKPVESIECPQSLSGEDVLPGFVLDLASIWETPG